MVKRITKVKKMCRLLNIYLTDECNISSGILEMSVLGFDKSDSNRFKEIIFKDRYDDFDSILNTLNDTIKVLLSRFNILNDSDNPSISSNSDISDKEISEFIKK